MVSNISMVGAFGAGVLSFLSPCVLPLVPPYLCFLAGVSLDQLTRGGDQPVKAIDWRVVASSAAFVLGFSTVFVALGASASAIGKAVTDHFDTLGIVAGVVIIVLGLHFLGVFRIGLLYREARFHNVRRGVGFVGAYVVGLAFAFGWTPCVGPVLATILLVAGVEGSAAHGAVLLGAYSLGIGLPFLLASLFSGAFIRLMARLRTQMATVEKVMGGALVLTGVLFLTGAMPRISGWLLQTFPAIGEIG
ncbi:cytochrome c biogenesis protein CcdA [Rhodopseudomonas thermotolerans]|uniref:Cytochrome c biogenesis protein CcdA n=2 Tax=Rhodopseudomonas TaxID=1073 RepID=A0A336JLW9_9BRAD|nr:MULTISPECIES: cytochrome c biogenesis protein CcdA [Rhodopseudomonas]RED36120.1 cytochrome c biogenesis protein CcdA [Rhodopseudomonas pentothenatexigens]REG03492.1 cytochrome c biogenesis protein CcdA [Rhodopseudomonas thermotolerans]SSW90680.1 cytochrome c biogenesis protein CcdA [Rhodopseudomonas pentothenatexigens]